MAALSNTQGKKGGSIVEGIRTISSGFRVDEEGAKVAAMLKCDSALARREAITEEDEIVIKDNDDFKNSKLQTTRLHHVREL